MDKIEQYSRSNCLILHGYTDAPDGKDKAFEDHAITKLNSNVDLPTHLQNSDIDIRHSLPSKSYKKPIIIKFVKRTVRNMVFSKKNNLKSDEHSRIKLSLTVCLTKRRVELIEETRSIFGF